MQITVDLTEQQAERLQQLAKSLSVDPGELVRVAVDGLLEHTGDDFEQAASYVLEKNKTLYERLS